MTVAIPTAMITMIGMATAIDDSYSSKNLKLKEDALLVPREGEVEAGTSEEAPDDDEHGPHHQEHRHHRESELPIVRLVRRVLVGERHDREEPERDAGNQHAGDHGMEHLQQLLQPEEVPRRLRRVRRRVDVGEPEQWGLHERG